MQYYTLKIVAIKQEITGCVTLSFKQPGFKKVKYQAGQYLTLMLRINGRRYIRPYSFSSAPGVDDTLDITIKRVPAGIASNHIVDQLKVNDMVEVMEPLGDFVLDADRINKDTRIVLWGAGSGITPLISIAKYTLFNRLARHVTLVYGNRNSESIIFGDLISEMEAQYQGSLSTWHFHTQSTVTENEPYLIQGRIDPNVVLSLMQREGDLRETIHYICGPTGLKESVILALDKLNVPAINIFNEDFEVQRDPAEFENVITRVISLKKGSEQTAVEVVKGKSILEASLDAGLELTYSCQTGNCLVCKGTLIKGEVKMIGVKKTPESLKADETLLCCSFPLTDDVEINVD